MHSGEVSGPRTCAPAAEAGTAGIAPTSACLESHGCNENANMSALDLNPVANALEGPDVRVPSSGPDAKNSGCIPP